MVRLWCGVLTPAAPTQSHCEHSSVPTHGDVAVCSTGQALEAVRDGVPALALHLLRT